MANRFSLAEASQSEKLTYLTTTTIPPTIIEPPNLLSLIDGEKDVPLTVELQTDTVTLYAANGGRDDEEPDGFVIVVAEKDVPEDCDWVNNLPRLVTDNNEKICLESGKYRNSLTVNANNFTLTGEADDECYDDDWTVLSGNVTINGHNATFENVKFTGVVDENGYNIRFINCCKPSPTTTTSTTSSTTTTTTYLTTTTTSPPTIIEPPNLLSPIDGEKDVPLTVELQTDTDTVKTLLPFGQTQWRVFKDGEKEDLLDVLSATHLTSLKVPDTVLEEGTQYYWQARYYDNEGTASDWPEANAFTTVVLGEDENLNGIPDDQEVAIGTDMDGDGTADETQDHIKSVNTVVGDGQIGLSTKDSSTITAIESLKSVDPATIADMTNRPDNMPLGLISFKLLVSSRGDTAEIVIYLSEPADDDAKWIRYNSLQGWEVYPYAYFNANRTQVTLQLQDGEYTYGDGDITENGIIVDPSGIGTLSDNRVEGLSEAVAEDGGGGGCFIDTVGFVR